MFGSFLFDLDRAIKLLGVGLAVAVLLDATIVRMLLVPASMELQEIATGGFPLAGSMVTSCRRSAGGC
ncbi:MAG: hypothetical protein R2843_11420 [Thermomicrobiales bacterium]